MQAQLTDEAFDRIEALDDLAKRHGVKLLDVAMGVAWRRVRPCQSVIAGATSARTGAGQRRRWDVAPRRRSGGRIGRHPQLSPAGRYGSQRLSNIVSVVMLWRAEERSCRGQGHRGNELALQMHLVIPGDRRVLTEDRGHAGGGVMGGDALAGGPADALQVRERHVAAVGLALRGPVARARRKSTRNSWIDVNVDSPLGAEQTNHATLTRYSTARISSSRCGVQASFV